jgi:hypothetical protein
MAMPPPDVTSLYHAIGAAPMAWCSPADIWGGSAPDPRGGRRAAKEWLEICCPALWLAAALYHLIGRPVDARLRDAEGQVHIR